MRIPHYESLKNDRVLGLLPLSLLMAICMGVYVDGLFGGFLFDDYPNIVNNNLLQATDGTLYHWWLAALSSHAGLLRRPFSMLSFAANIYLFGMNPIAFKLVNIFIHLLNGLLVYFLSHALLPLMRPSRTEAATKDWIIPVALAITGFWMLHPLLVSNVVYIVQRMNLLAALFTLLGLYCYVVGRRNTLQSARGWLVAFSGLTVFAILATLCKENGALTFLYALVIEAVLFRFDAPESIGRKLAVSFFTLTVALPVALFGTYLLLHPHWLVNSYTGRAYTLAQRLLTEPRVLMDYLQWTFFPKISSMGLYHDDIMVSIELFSPVSTFISILFCSALGLFAWRVRNWAPALTFAVAWFFAGHAMESTVLPLEIAFEHRNYLPMVGLLLGTVAAVSQAVPMRRFAGFTAASMVLVCVLAGLTASRAADWGDPIRLAMITAENHPDSPRSLYDAGRAVILSAEAAGKVNDAVRAKAGVYFERAMVLDKTYLYPATSAILTGYHQKQVPESAIGDLAIRLKHTPLFHATPFLMLLQAAGDGQFLISPTDAECVVTAALDNPTATQGMRAMILNDYGRYLFVVEHDVQRAVSLTLAAAEMAPGNSLFQINLTRLALALGQPEIAEVHLTKAKGWDKIGIYANDLRELSRQVEGRRAFKDRSSGDPAATDGRLGIVLQ